VTWVELGRYPRVEAQIIVGRLTAEGLTAVAFDAEASIADGSYLLIPTRVMVAEGDADEARQIIDDAA
jgi:hypothetical protein